MLTRALRLIHSQTDTEEYSTDMLSVTVAQRYSILVTARNDTTPTNWAIHANMDTDMFDTVPDSLNPSAYSFVYYLFFVLSSLTWNLDVLDRCNLVDHVRHVDRRHLDGFRLRR